MSTLTLELDVPVVVVDRAYARAALRECIQYHEHGNETEIVNNKVVCFNCGGSL